MSYILEALEKLGENRPETGPPGARKEPDKNAARPRRLRFLPYLIGAVLLINAGILLWWLYPSKPAAVVPAPQPSPATFTPSVPPSVKLPQSAQEETSGRGGDYNQAGNIREDREDSRPAPAEAGTGNAGMAREDRRVYSLNDLPSHVRQGLPPVSISGHSYSADPSLRIVLINGSTMREGQAVTGGLRLEQITTDGVVLSYQGYRFRKGVF